MNREQTPFFLHEAVVSLYPAAADGSAIVTAPIWCGALANQLSMRMAYEELKIMGAGEPYSTAHHLDEEHIIEIARTWLIRRASPVEFVPGRNQPYVLEFVWNDEEAGIWHARTYYGVTARSVEWISQGTNQFSNRQVWRAQRFVQSGGSGSPGGQVYTPLGDTETQAVPFFREDPLVVGEYLMGHYRWPVAVNLGIVEAIGWASQGTDTTLALEIDGVLVGPTVTLPAGTANTEVTGSVDLGGLLVYTGSEVRWKITGGPDPENAAWVVSLTMQVTPQ